MNNKHDNIPEHWDKILSSVRAALPYNRVVLAGGCIRDHQLGMPAKDFDVFTDIESELELLFVADQIGANFRNTFDCAFRYDLLEPEDNSLYKYQILHSSSSAYEGAPLGVAGVLDFAPGAIQIIAKPMKDWDVTNLVETFDYSRVKCWYDGHSIQETKECEADRKAGDLKYHMSSYLKGNEDGKKTTERRILRWKQRFANHKEEEKRRKIVEANRLSSFDRQRFTSPKVKSTWNNTTYHNMVWATE